MKINRQIAWLAAIGAMVSCQVGATQAKALFAVVDTAGATFLRVGISALLMLILFRPRIGQITREQWKRIVLYGLSVAAMNFIFYCALRTTPLGICVTVEFVGPLSLALIFSRKPLDFLWTALAVAGIALIVPWTEQTGDVPLTGVLLAATAGVGWAFYILATNHVTKITRATYAAALGMAVAALATLPLALFAGGVLHLTRTATVPALAVAIFSSALPFTLELVALKGLPEKTFSITLSVEPAIAALCGFLFLGETLTPIQLLAMACVIVASIGSTRTK